MPWKSDQQLFKESIQQGSKSAQKLFRSSEIVSANEGLRVYQEALDIRLAGFLRADFPVLAKLLGERFESIAREYRHHYPSRYASGTDFGRYFPDFISSLKWNGPESAAADLASFEWKLVELLYSPEVASLGLEKISTAQEEDWQNARLIFDSSYRIISSIYPLEKIYEEECWSFGAGVELLLWRQENEAHYRSISAEESELIQALSAGLRLKEIKIEKNQFEPSLFATWLETGLVRGIRWA